MAVKIHRFDDEQVGFFCPGCKCWHGVRVAGEGRKKWLWNGSMEAPTFTPNINIEGVCNSFVINGSITFLRDSSHSRSGQTVEIPDCDGQEGALICAKPVVHADSVGMRGRTRILVVDDERFLASTLATILERQGYETIIAHSGEEAVHAASSFQPDCLLSDIEMGSRNGIDAALEISGFLPNCKVLFVSGHVSRSDALGKAKEKGFDFEFMSKPVPPPELLQKISQVLQL
ncbi:MAG: hypothetical protein CXZ00_00170 [Acidobacteria bacterium]|nr:MAG: hypothetical protein CXZ00_00170 [Acidobacteriota bacterium]